MSSGQIPLTRSAIPTSEDISRRADSPSFSNLGSMCLFMGILLGLITYFWYDPFVGVAIIITGLVLALVFYVLGTREL